MNDIGLVCEGGGLRCIYTSGVLDYFLDRNLHFKYSVGVSAGAIYPPSYLSKQKKRMLDIQKTYINDPEYMGYKHLLKTGTYVNNDFAYNRMTKEFFPFDFEEFMNKETTFKAGAFNCITGKTDFFSKNDFTNVDDFLEVLIASGSLPFISKKVIINGIPYLDGGIKSPIPLNESIKDGNKFNVVILTQDSSYKKEAFKYSKSAKLFYMRYPLVAKAILDRHNLYNTLIEKLEDLEKKGEIFIIRPSEKVDVERLETDVNKIEELYELGLRDATQIFDDLKKWIDDKSAQYYFEASSSLNPIK